MTAARSASTSLDRNVASRSSTSAIAASSLNKHSKYASRRCVTTLRQPMEPLRRTEAGRPRSGGLRRFALRRGPTGRSGDVEALRGASVKRNGDERPLRRGLMRSSRAIYPPVPNPGGCCGVLLGEMKAVANDLRNQAREIA